MQSGFVENHDWQFAPIGATEAQGLSAVKVKTLPDNYWLSIECFKHFAMMARTEKGKLVRAYFIECETRMKAAFQPLPADPMPSPDALADMVASRKQLAHPGFSQGKAARSPHPTIRPAYHTR